MNYAQEYFSIVNERSRAMMEQCKRHYRLLLDDHICYDDPIDAWEWQVMADLFISGWEENDGQTIQ